MTFSLPIVSFRFLLQKLKSWGKTLLQQFKVSELDKYLNKGRVGGVVPRMPLPFTHALAFRVLVRAPKRQVLLHDCEDTLRALWAAIIKYSMCHSCGLCFACSLQGWRTQLLAIDLSWSCYASVLPAGLWLSLKFEKEWSNKHLEAGLCKRADDAAFDRETCGGWRSAFESMQALATDRSWTCCTTADFANPLRGSHVHACPGIKRWRTDAW